MGAHFYIMPRLERLAKASGLRVRSVKRSGSASPARGSPKRTSWNKRRCSLCFYHLEQ